MKCPKCQHKNPDGAKFCNECAQELILSSDPSPQALSFDEKIDKIKRYLPKGLTEKILSQKDKIEGERKQVSVMFCDMEGFTHMVELLGPEKAYSVMDKVYDILIHNVHDCEGTVIEMTGDGIMALFGAPIALEGAPHRALRSALSIHNDIDIFNGNKSGIDPVKMRIGIHTGPVVVGTLGNDLRVEFKAVGDTVNLASRMEGLSEPGTTFVTDDTFKLTEGLFQFEALGEKEFKGKSSCIPVYKLLSVKKDVYRPRLGIERSIYSEMVGRDKELNRLELQVLKAVNGEGSIVNIIGEAGIGKSRLMAELKNREVMKQVYMFEGRSISTGRNLSFYTIIDLVKHWARIGEDDSGAVALSKLENSITRLFQEDTPEILPFVGKLMGMKLSGRYAERVKGMEGEALEKLILKSMRDLLFRATELSPLVIVSEDLHWADTSSIVLMESLFRLAETQRIVFANVFRPGYKETADRIIETIKERYPKNYVEIGLQPLNEQMSETLIDNMLNIKGMRYSVINHIVERSDGNPFFIEEVVRSLIDQGAVVSKDEAFEITKKLDTIVIPQSINDVLMARIDGLDDKTRDLVKVASVIGRSFFYRILTEVSQTINDIDDKLFYLKGIQLIRERKRMEELEYLFKHALSQEAAYESILHQTRMDLHIKVAGSIEKVFKERVHEFYGMLAYHYSKGEDLEKTEEYMIKAGEEALNSSASYEALGYYKEALRLYRKRYGDSADPEKLTMLEKNIALALFNKGEHEEAVEYFDSVLKRYGIKSIKNRILTFVKFLFDLLVVTFNLYFPSKKPRKVPTKKESEISSLCIKKTISLQYINQMRLVAENMGEIRRIIKFDLKKIKDRNYTIVTAGVIFSALGILPGLSKRFLEFSEGFIDQNNNEEILLLKFGKLFHNLSFGKWNEVQDYDEILVNENLRVGNVLETSHYAFYYGKLKIYQGKFKDVYPLIDKLAKIAAEYEYIFATQFQLWLELHIFLIIKNLGDAQKIIDRYELLFSHYSDPRAIIFLGFKAELQTLLKDYDGAQKSLNQLEEIATKQTLLAPTASYFFWAKFFLNINQLEESIISINKSDISKYREKAFKSGERCLKNAIKVQFNHSRTLNLLGRYYWLIGKHKKAVKFWKRSIKEGARLCARPDLARTYMEIGKRFLEEKSKYKELNGISAEEYLEKARTMFQEMDLQWDLDELDKIVASV